MTLFCQELLAPIGYALQRAIVTSLGLAVMFITRAVRYMHPELPFSLHVLRLDYTLVPEEETRNLHSMDPGLNRPMPRPGWIRAPHVNQQKPLPIILYLSEAVNQHLT